LKSTPNGGVAVTEDLKYNSKQAFVRRVENGANIFFCFAVKFSRQNSIHVSPTVLFDGLVANEVSSSWGEAEWTEFFQRRIAV
jgi:hypothetical protein